MWEKKKGKKRKRKKKKEEKKKKKKRKKIKKKKKKVMPNANNNLITATWSETGKVYIWDLTSFQRSLENPQNQPKAPTGPVFTFGGHPTEGFSMDWSPTTTGRFVYLENFKAKYYQMTL